MSARRMLAVARALVRALAWVLAMPGDGLYPDPVSAPAPWR